mmetsp:Transcript_59295/g.109581  ORF Transcript_59295/g.109581 Transcript_59295/m.109581 type:complete len:900 (-) Transcript_59295:153-2852(-)
MGKPAVTPVATPARASASNGRVERSVPSGKTPLVALEATGNGSAFAMDGKTPTAKGQEGRMYIVREAIMPMLTVSGNDKPIIMRAFRPPTPGGMLSGLQGKTLGTRKRFQAGDVTPARFFKEDSPPALEAETDNGSHKLVLWTPPKDNPDGRREVVVDPLVSKVLREHQRIGVQFLFDCLMGYKAFDGCGCILADDMGLGKTLQSVAVIWTLLTQGGPGGKPACQKALVVCPASLVKNWAGEFDKWLAGRLKYTAIAEPGAAKVTGSFQSFRYNRESKVLIASYETFRGHATEVEDCGIELIVCDEAHKLKNDEAATTRCIAGLRGKRRLLISGTPIQNNLDEFFTLVSVANPGVFGDLSAFKRNYAAAILRGREPTATAEEREDAQAKLAKVSEVTEQFILRRTNRLNARFLPPKQLFNVFVRATKFQTDLYKRFLRSNVTKKLLESENMKMSRTVLGTIKKLQSLVNHPFLVRSNTQGLEAGFDDEETLAMFAKVDAQDKHLRANQRPVRQELSGKMSLVHHILTIVKESGSGDRVVIISNWTSTLDVVEKMCAQNSWPVHRLDGSMAIAKRMKLVQDFNRPDNQNAYVFLLSSKAGGCGLNLVGANRLVMYDPDWNPANDRQAMARIWRDGQKKKCFIYRLFTTGTIEEKVYQRQICKDGLSTMMVTETGDDEATEMKESLASELIKDLFTFTEDTACATHDMLGCVRCKSCLAPGAKQPKAKDVAAFAPQEEEVIEDDLNTWSHHPGIEGVPDQVLVEAGRRMAGASSAGAAAGVQQRQGVSFTMGCFIQFTPEQIARLEEEERQEQLRREQANKATASSAAPSTAAAPKASPAPAKEVAKAKASSTATPGGSAPKPAITVQQVARSASASNDRPPAKRAKWARLDNDITITVPD